MIVGLKELLMFHSGIGLLFIFGAVVVVVLLVLLIQKMYFNAMFASLRKRKRLSFNITISSLSKYGIGYCPLVSGLIIDSSLILTAGDD
jgi:hypothetical protein